MEEWLALIEAAGIDLSMAPQWFSSTVKARDVEDDARVYTLHDGDRLVAIVPYVMRRERSAGIGLRSRELPGSYLVAYHPEIIATIDVEDVLRGLFADGARDSDVLVLPNIEKGGRTATAAHRVARELGLRRVTRPGHISPYLKIVGTWDEYLKLKPKKFRYKVRTALKELHAAGQVANRWFSDPDDVEDLLADMLRIEERSWKATANMAISGSEMESSYYKRLLPFLTSHRALRANVLYLNSNPIAYSLCYETNHNFRQLKTSFDQAYSNLSAGAVVHRLAIERAFENGVKEFDFLGDVMSHKTQWTSDLREHETIFLFQRNWRSLLVSELRTLIARARQLRRN